MKRRERLTPTANTSFQSPVTSLPVSSKAKYCFRLSQSTSSYIVQLVSEVERHQLAGLEAKTRMKGGIGWGLLCFVLFLSGGPEPAQGQDSPPGPPLVGFKRPAKRCRTLPSTVAAPGCIEFDPDPTPREFDILNAGDPKSLGQIKEHTVGKDVQIDKKDENEFTIPPLKLYRYFPNADIGNVAEDFKDTAFEMVEWPGRITDTTGTDEKQAWTHQSFLDNVVANRLQFQNVVGRKERFVPFSYQGQQSLSKSYLCNRDHGTHIRAMGFRTRKRTGYYQPFYLTTGDRSFTEHYIPPHFVIESELNLLAKDHSDPACQPITDGIIPITSKLNHILAFAFANNRLLLGMYCGIMVVKNLESSGGVSIESAKRNPSPDGFDEEEFIKDTYVKFQDTSALREQKFQAINRIASNTCCRGLCLSLPQLAVAFSYRFDHTERDMKVIYVSYDNGDTWSQKLLAPNAATQIQIFRGLYKKLEGELQEPDFIFQQVKKLKLAKKWNKEEDDDHVARVILGKGRIEEEEDPYETDGTLCAQIVSMEVVPEENSILALCRTDRGPPLAYNHPLNVEPNRVALNMNYAVFEFRVSQYSPILIPKLRSQRRLACTVRRLLLGPRAEYHEPSINRAHNSFNLFILGCDTILYFSINGGQTFFNTQFYNVAEDGRAERRPQEPEFDFPLMASDPDGQSVVFVFGHNYAFGMINYNREFRLIVGTVAQTNGKVKFPKVCLSNTERSPNCAECKNSALAPGTCADVLVPCADLGKSIAAGTSPLPIPGGPSAGICQPWAETVIPFTTHRKIIPYYSNNGNLRFSVVPMHFLTESADYETRRLYDNRLAIRLIDFPFQITNALRPYFGENTKIPPQNKWQGFNKCPTFGFVFNPKEVELDLGESVTFNVSSEDSIDVPLNIITSISDLFEVKVESSNRSQGHPHEVRRFEWDVTIKALGVLKTDLEMQEDVFFGSDYSRYVQKTANVILTTYPQIRCHTQPTGNAIVQMGCKKRLVAHEDFRRPQCSRFFKKFNFTLKHGEYDPDMVDYWIKKRPQHYRRRGQDVQVTYDYQTFGCPILPYRLDPFVPDLRVLDMNKKGVINGTGFLNTSAGVEFYNDYVLIEIHGQKGFSYSSTVKDAKCKRPPATLRRMMRRWRQRKTILEKAFDKYRNFNLESVHAPQNIWPKILHIPCDQPDPKVKNSVDRTRILEDDQYEIMNRGSDNSIIWESNRHKEVYIFLAIEVGQNGTFCDHTAFFGVTVSVEEESPVVVSMLRFFACLLGLLLLVYSGYFVFRIYSRRSYRTTALLSRLERGAWEILLRYERYLHEIKMGPERARMAEAAAKRASAKKSQITTKEKERGRDRHRKSRVRPSVSVPPDPDN